MALGDILGALVNAVGADAEEIVHEADDAASDEDARASILASMQRTRKPREVLDL